MLKGTFRAFDSQEWAIGGGRVEADGFTGGAICPGQGCGQVYDGILSGHRLGISLRREG